MTQPGEAATAAPTGGAPAGAGPGAGTVAKGSGRSGGGRLGPPSWLALFFLLPALLILGALVVYPIVYSVYRSMFDASGDTFVGADNYLQMFTDRDSLVAIRNTAIWVVVAPALVTAIGLVFAVLTERIRWAAAFKMIVFMPMAISFLASGVVFRLVYEQDPEKGVANAAIVAAHDTFAGKAGYPGAGPRPTAATPIRADGGAVVSKRGIRPGQAALLPLVKVKAENIPPEAGAVAPRVAPVPGALTGTVWFDFTKGGGGRPEIPDTAEKGLPGIAVEAVGPGGKVAGRATTRPDGTFSIAGLDPGASYTIRLPKENFAASFRGADWLGDTLVTPAIIASYIWVWAGFAMVLIAAGLASIPRDALEAARVDGATEAQVFRRVTMPLLSPVLVVVFVTLVINVMKVFDLVYIIGGGDPAASVLALQMWVESFGGGDNEGMGSAIAVFLFLLVLPAMLFNLRRFRRERP